MSNAFSLIHINLMKKLRFYLTPISRPLNENSIQELYEWLQMELRFFSYQQPADRAITRSTGRNNSESAASLSAPHFTKWRTLPFPNYMSYRDRGNAALCASLSPDQTRPDQTPTDTHVRNFCTLPGWPRRASSLVRDNKHHSADVTCFRPEWTHLSDERRHTGWNSLQLTLSNLKFE